MIRVRIPATTANLGPGFDCLGLALDLWNSFEFHPGVKSTWNVITNGEGKDKLAPGPTNLVVLTFIDECNFLGIEPPLGGDIICHNSIPPASGLGSSSTATLAGILFAHAWQKNLKGENPAEINFDVALERAVKVEGHGDNVAPALLGGFVMVMPDGDKVITQSLPFVPIQAVVCVPEFNFLTSEARSVLPDSYSKSDAIFNIGRAMLVVEALRLGDDEMLAKAMNDRIHEPYRLAKIPGAEKAKANAIEAGALAVALSGAGPGVIAFTRSGFDRIGTAMNQAFAENGLKSRYWILDTTTNGTHIGRLPV